MKILRILTVTVLVLSFCLALFACDKNGGDKPDTTTAKPETTTTAVAEVTTKPETTTTAVTEVTTKPETEVTTEGDGKPTEPTAYNIGTLTELLAFMNEPDLDGEYTLTADIVFNDTANLKNWKNTPPANTWKPVGSSGEPFTGSFDGQGHKITGLYIVGEKRVGFFGALDGAVVKDFIIGEGYVFALTDVAGALSAYYYGDTVISGCVNYADVTANTYVGGFVGKYTDAAGCNVKISNCVNHGDISGMSDGSGVYVGGIAAYCCGVSIDSCANFGSISAGVGVSEKGALAGGITGCIGSSQGYSETVSNCYNAGTVTVTQATGNAAVGGIAGRMSNSNGKVIDCFNIGTIYVNGTELAMTAYVAAENSGHNDYTENVYNSGKVYLIGTETAVTPAFTEKGLSGSVATGTGAVIMMKLSSDIWQDTGDYPILKGIATQIQQH